MKRFVALLVIVALCLIIPQGSKVHYQFTISSDTSRLDIQAVQIDTPGSIVAPWGGCSDMDIGITFWGTNFGGEMKLEQRSLLAFRKKIDSLRTYLGIDTGIVSIDSGKIGLTIGIAITGSQRLKVALVRLRSGVGTASRHFIEGCGFVYNDSIYGARWDYCVAKANAGDWLAELPWTAPGARGAGDTAGGVIDYVWIDSSNHTDSKVYFNLDAAALSDTATDTTASRSPGYLLYLADTSGFQSQPITTWGGLFSLCTGDVAQATDYCDSIQFSPELTVYISFEQNIVPHLQGIGNVKNIGKVNIGR